MYHPFNAIATLKLLLVGCEFVKGFWLNRNVINLKDSVL
jgi:hypothetical protein